MQTLGNLLVGAILAGISLGPVPWADARLLLDTPLSRAAATIGGTGEIDHAVATARTALAHLPDSAQLRH
ncbi:MAG TPA: hypothetical protein VII56_19845 [Rhizomicrobium sp.]